MIAHSEICSCGEVKSHPICRRATASGSHVVLWSDGTLCWTLGRYVKGSPHPRNADQIRNALSVGWRVMDRVCLYEDDEIEGLIDAIRFPRRTKHKLSPVWIVTRADRDGVPTERWWILPRIRWPGLAICDTVTHGHGGRYNVMFEIPTPHSDSDKSYRVGLSFRRLSDVLSHLESYPSLETTR